MVRLFSGHFPPELVDLVPASCVGLEYATTLTYGGDAAATVAELKALHDVELQSLAEGHASAQRTAADAHARPAADDDERPKPRARRREARHGGSRRCAVAARARPRKLGERTARWFAVA